MHFRSMLSMKSHKICKICEKQLDLCAFYYNILQRSCQSVSYVFSKAL